MAAQAGVCDFGWKAPAFELPGVDGKMWASDKLMGANGLLIMFICNHCPYVIAITARLAEDVAKMREAGIGVVAICSNDAAAYPQDSFDNMKIFASRNGFEFPYLHDVTQRVARDYDAVCTPDFFGFNARFELQYRGRIDEGGRNAPPPGARRELREAMIKVAKTGHGPAAQTPSMGCSIKWKP
ncbi:MAG: thioredoxin family protein [Alphaproteobacteria bacterium]